MSMMGGNKRDYLEIDENGQTRGKNRQDKTSQYMQGVGNKKGLGGKLNRFKGRFGNRGYRGTSAGGYGKSTIWTWVLLIVALSLLIGLVVNLFRGSLFSWQRSAFSDIDENYGMVENQILETNKRLKDTYLTDEEREQNEIYRKNEIHSLKYIDKQPYQEYIVYVYSNSEDLNSEYNKYVSTMENREGGYPVPFYRISTDITDESYIVDVLGENKPGFIVFRDNTGEIELDSYINDPELFGDVEGYINKVIAEDDEYLKGKVGRYKDFNRGQTVE